MQDIYTIPRNNPFTFIQEREGLVEDILEWAGTLDSNTKFVYKLPAFLLDFDCKIAKFKNDYTDTPGISACFSTRCKVLRKSIKIAKLLFEAECRSKWEMVMILKWIGIQIGRLRLNPIFGADKPADSREEEAAEILNLWSTRACHGFRSSLRLWSSSPVLSDSWLTLHFPISRCLCVQCIRLREYLGIGN